MRKVAKLPATSEAGVGKEDGPGELAQQLEAALRTVAAHIEKHGRAPGATRTSVQLHQSKLNTPVDAEGLETLQASVDKIAGLLSSRVNSVGSADQSVPSLFTRLSSAFGKLQSPSPQPFPISTFRLDVAPFHPSPPQVQRTWYTFLLNIDPLVKILHRSTTERILHKVVQNPTSLSNGETAVIFTIYFSSLSAMSDEEAEECFNIPKRQAQAAYRAGAEHALMQTDLLTTNDLTTLQGFVLFLSLGRFTDDATRIWALTGLVRRLDGITSAGVSPFEDEIRRRLRWELWYLDHRAHEDGGKGTAPPDTGGSPELPLNVRDKNLDPVTNVAPYPEAAWTEISFSLIRFDIARTARIIEFLPSVPLKLALIDDCEQRIASMYLCHCDDTQTIHWLARHVSHVLIMELRFKLLRREPQSEFSPDHQYPSSQAVQYDLFVKAMDIVDTPTRIKMEPHAKHWSWLLSGYMQFQPLSFLLSELCYRHGSEEVDRAWDIAERAILRRKENGTSKNMGILRQLMEQARLERELMESAQLDTRLLEVAQMPSDSPSSGATALHTPTHLEHSMWLSPNDMSYPSSHNMQFDQLQIPTTVCNDLGWDGFQFEAEGAPDIPLDFNFSEEHHLVGPDDSGSTYLT